MTDKTLNHMRVSAERRTIIMHVDGLKYRTWRYDAPLGHTIEDVLSKEYFWKTKDLFEVGDTLEIDAEDGSFFLWVRIVAIHEMYGHVHVQVRQREEYAKRRRPADPEMPEGFDVEHQGAGKWRIRRNGELIGKLYASKEEAIFAIQAEAVKAAQLDGGDDD